MLNRGVCLCMWVPEAVEGGCPCCHGDVSGEESCYGLPVFPHLRGLSPVSHLSCV